MLFYLIPSGIICLLGFLTNQTKSSNLKQIVSHNNYLHCWPKLRLQIFRALNHVHIEIEYLAKWNEWMDMNFDDRYKHRIQGSSRFSWWLLVEVLKVFGWRWKRKESYDVPNYLNTFENIELQSGRQLDAENVFSYYIRLHKN